MTVDLRAIKVGRLLLAVVVTMIVADTVPHPNLSPGLLESSVTQLRLRLAETSEPLDDFQSAAQ